MVGLDYFLNIPSSRLNASSTSLVRKILNSKHYPAEKSPDKISSIESTDTPQS